MGILLRTIDCLSEGSLDFYGQRRAYWLHVIAIWISGFVGVVHGYVIQSFLATFLWIFVTSVIVALVRKKYLKF